MSHLHIAHVHELPTFTLSGSNPTEQLESALGPVFQSMHFAVPQLHYAGIPKLSGALKTPVRAGEQDETDHKIHVHVHVEKM